MNPSASLPIGIFDSGMGGLTVLKAISGRLPGENLLYLGDTARLPYGTKSRDTIIRYTLKAAGRLVDEGVKMLVVACNTATSAALPELREHFAPLPVLGVVRPGAEAAVAASRNKRIVVIATEATIAGGAYQQAIGVLYAVAYTLKMSCKTDYKMEGFFEYVVPPLEGFWWQDGKDGIDYADKSAFHWISVIRLPDFVTRKDFAWAVETAAKKKKLDCSAAEFLTIEEGLCVQMMHLGPFDQEPASVALMDAHLAEHGYENDLSETRLHHEIYLSDARKVAPEKWRTVIRHPIKKR